jgi:hypothetical protein
MDGKACRRDPPKRSVRYVCIGSSGWRSLAWARDGKAARCLRPPGQSESGRLSGPSGADSPVSDRAFADSSARRRASHLAWLGGGLVSNSRPIQSLSSLRLAAKLLNLFVGEPFGFVTVHHHSHRLAHAGRFLREAGPMLTSTSAPLPEARLKPFTGLFRSIHRKQLRPP